MPEDRKHFFVKHDLRSLTALPNFVWRTEKEMPPGMRRIKEGDRWIAFAYIDDEENRQPVSLVTGFYECRASVERRRIPLEAADPAISGETHAWMIEGDPIGKQPREPVAITSIDRLLGRPTFKGAMLVPVKPEEFDYIYKHVMGMPTQ